MSGPFFRCRRLRSCPCAAGSAAGGGGKAVAQLFAPSSGRYESSSSSPRASLPFSLPPTSLPTFSPPPWSTRLPSRPAARPREIRPRLPASLRLRPSSRCRPLLRDSPGGGRRLRTSRRRPPARRSRSRRRLEIFAEEDPIKVRCFPWWGRARILNLGESPDFARFLGFCPSP